jgi:hypothetical protein
MPEVYTYNPVNPDLVFTEDEAIQVYEALKELSVGLDDNPLEFGPRRLNQKISETRKLLDICEGLFLDVSQKLHVARRTKTLESALYDIEFKSMLANDPHVRLGRSQIEREAFASERMKKHISEITRLDIMVQDLEQCLTVIKAKRTDLKDIQGRLKDQIRLCQEEIGLGQHWGTKVPNSKDLPNFATAADLSTLDKIMGDMKEEIHVLEKEGSWISGTFNDPDLYTETLPEDVPPDEPADEPIIEESINITKDLPVVGEADSECDKFLCDLGETKADNATGKKSKKIDDPINDDFLSSIMKDFESIT